MPAYQGSSVPVGERDQISPDTFKPIAICGMALRLPGGISNPSQFWDFLLTKGDARSRVPESRYRVSSYYSETERHGTLKTQYGYFLDESIDLGSLDTSFFSFTKSELEFIDPQQRQILEVVRECFESAGETDYRGKQIGCYVGSFGEDWIENLYHELQMYGKYPLMIGMDFSLPNRISFEYDLRGPSLSVRTACSSTLSALHEACLALERGECSAAVVAGCNITTSPTMTLIMSVTGVLSSDGNCKSFDADADGYGRGEAINAIYIKLLEDAVRDGNPIRAVIRGTAINSDGKTSGFHAPSVSAHESLIRKAYLAAGIDDLTQTAFVECHSTGTSVGDPLEANAVANAFGDKGLYIGSTVLALEHKTIPPNIKFNKPNPKIPFESKNLKVPIEPTQWPQDRALRASVNSFGMGGANAHVILESAENFVLPSSPRRRRVIKFRICYALEDLAYTLGVRREHLPFRAASVVNGQQSIITTSFVKAPQSPPNIAFVFTGQGAQWPRMGVQLYESYAVFRRSIMSLDEVLQKLPDAPDWLIRDEMMKDEEQSNLHKASYTQPICTAIQIALVDLLRTINITPSAVIGHSSGELAAAYAADRLSSSHAIISAFYRGVVSENVIQLGGMAAIGLSKGEVDQFLTSGVVVACENSQSSVTISGDQKKLEEVMQAISASHPEVLVRRVKVDVAYHSHHMRDIGETYRSLLDRQFFDGTCSNSSSAHFFSSVSGLKLDESDQVDSRYWQSNLESPVLFHTALKELMAYHKNKQLVFLEVGPHSALSGPVRQAIDQASRGDQYVSCLMRHKACSESFLSAVGKLYCLDVPIDFDTLTNAQHNARVLTDLPTYCWDHSHSILYEPRLNKEWRWTKYPKHQLLGIRSAESTDNEPSWRNVLLLEHVPWLQDHKVGGSIIFPAAAYILMIGEALNQINSAHGGFRIRNMVLSTAMVLTDSKTTEIITSLRKDVRGDWYDFKVGSHNGAGWIDHCHGQARWGNPGHGAQHIDGNTISRPIGISSWYETLRREGLDFGPAFRCVSDLSCSTTQHISTAKVGSTVHEAAYYYTIHPTRLDGVFQTVLAAIYKGLDWAVDQLYVPVSIAEIDICECTSDMNTKVWVRSSNKDRVTLDGEAIGPDGNVVVRVRDATVRPIISSQTAQREQKPRNLARLNWAPDIRFLRLADLITSAPNRKEHTELLNQLTSLCVDQALCRLRERGVSSKTPHLQKYHRWLEKQPPPTYRSTIESVLTKVSATPVASCATAVVKVLENIVPICRGEIEPLQVLMEDDTLLRLYNYMGLSDRAQLFRSIGHGNPRQRILEIGAGTGGTTARLIQDTRYSSYTFTDISSGFFPAAKERFKNFQHLNFKTLDITKDPLSQGFEAGSFDLIVAANVLHATPNLHETLANVRRLLHPRGKLFLEELCTESKFANFICGTLPGWWAGEADGRPDEPYVSPERWEQELKDSGFNGLDGLAYDAPPPYHLSAYMLASPHVPELTPKKRVTLLCDTASAHTAEQFQQVLLSRGYNVGIHGLDHHFQMGQPVIVLVDTVSPFFDDLDTTKLSAFQSFLSQLEESHSRAFWVTRSCQLNCDDPRFSSALGVARTIRSEYGIKFGTCEVDLINDANISLVIDVFERFDGPINEEVMIPEQEYAIVDNVVQIGRILPFSPAEELSLLGKLDWKDGDPVLKLDIDTSGLLGSFVWKVDAEQQVLGDNEVEIEVHSAGLNFADVLIALRTIEPLDNRLGLEASGIVRRAGSAVRGLCSGDRVFSIGPGSFATSIIVSAELCVKIPDGLSLGDASALPVVFSTVIRSLMDLGRLEKAQTILIHSACGGIGLAAIQIAQMIGATIYATVGNGEKVEHLIKTYGIPRDHIFSSRDSSFLAGIMTATNGRGVDLVLNSLAGDLFHVSCQCVTDYGTMINLTKRDRLEGGNLPLKYLKSNTSYHAVDLADLIQVKPKEQERLLLTIVKLYEQGHIKAIVPVYTFPANAVKDCFRYMQAGQHMGKLTVLMDQQKKDFSPRFPSKTVAFQRDASYLLVGGLGGLGGGLARWMAEHGARHLIILSRGAGETDSDKMLFSELESQGCSVTAVKGSVGEMSDVERAISLATATAPLKGVFNLAMVLRDSSLLNMSLDDWNAATVPKVQGAWNLHQATLKHDLDFFVLFSSMCGIVGMPGQANYAAANTFTDAFVQYRQRSKLPASVIDVGAVEGIGFIAENPQVLQRSKWINHFSMSQKELFEAVTITIFTGLPQQEQAGFGYVNSSQIMSGFRSGPGSRAPNTNMYAFDRRFDASHSDDVAENTDVDKSASMDKLAQFLKSAATDRAVLSQSSASDFVALEIAKWVFDLLMKPVEDESEIDVSRSLYDVGLDSLSAVEVRSWWKKTFGLEIGVLEIMSFPSFSALGQYAVEGLTRRFWPEESE
ncbi:Highly reducing polyketide synthase VdtX [Cladobotryum mycophilum]|uniref:Highly reducing polyketide synthase VdtX n=1 Tax=Cladobotryum mycophilum TaxID=491253 RepID=A0ABR0S509_9HYPO